MNELRPPPILPPPLSERLKKGTGGGEPDGAEVRGGEVVFAAWPESPNALRGPLAEVVVGAEAYDRRSHESSSGDSLADDPLASEDILLNIHLKHTIPS